MRDWEVRGIGGASLLAKVGRGCIASSCSVGRPLRFIPPECPLVEVTCRTLQGRMLLRPSDRLNRIVYGLVARAARRYSMRVCAFVYLSNHCHLLLRPADADQLAGFMGYLNGNLAREAGRLHAWREKFWGQRYRAIPVSFEVDEQIARFEYLLAHGCKENLVARPQDWPGASSTRALLTGERIQGIWYDRTRQYRSNRAGGGRPEEEFASIETLELSPLPCWDRLSAHSLALRILELVEKVSREARQRAKQSRIGPMGRRRILRQDPHRRPRTLKRSPAPLFHAATFEIRRMLERMYREYYDAYRDARERVRQQSRPGAFPRYGIPPPWAPAI